MSLPKNTEANKAIRACRADDLVDSDRDATLAALLTGVGRSAIAVIELRGPRAPDVIAACFRPTTQREFRPGQIRYGKWDPEGSKNRSEVVSRSNLQDESGSQTSHYAGESVVVVPISERRFEVHCHGGTAATDRILNDISVLGVGVLQHDDQRWTQNKPLLIREAESVLSRCLTAKTAAIALDQVRGAMLNWCEAAIDGSTSLDVTKQKASEMLHYSNFSTRLADRFRVVFAGPPNVGKSSLINAIVGYDRSITMDAPGTTRDVLHADTVIDGIPLRISDTAGIRTQTGEIERAGIEKAHRAADSADLVVWVSQFGVDGEPKSEFESISQKTLNVVNKVDLARENEAFQGDAIPTVATTGQGITGLMNAIVSKLIGATSNPGDPVPINRRQEWCLRLIAESTDVRKCRQALIRLLSDAQ